MNNAIIELLEIELFAGSTGWKQISDVYLNCS